MWPWESLSLAATLNLRNLSSPLMNMPGFAASIPTIWPLLCSREELCSRYQGCWWARMSLKWGQEGLLWLEKHTCHGQGYSTWSPWRQAKLRVQEPKQLILPDCLTGLNLCSRTCLTWGKQPQFSHLWIGHGNLERSYEQNEAIHVRWAERCLV